jgi:hypothetical protein
LPDAAIVQARAALKTQPASVEYARIIADAAELSKDTRLRTEALEQLLASEGTLGDPAAQLWGAYVAQAEAAGNRAQLLRGDDGSWLAMAAGLSASDPLEGRAVYAYLVERGASAEARELALSKLFAALVAGQLETTAVRLFAAAPWGGEKRSLATVNRVVQRATEGVPPAETRGLMIAAGRYAESADRFDVAADYYVQAVLASDMRAPDLVATQALKGAIDSMERAGFKEDAAAFYRRMVALREPAKKVASPKAKKGKRKK